MDPKHSDMKGLWDCSGSVVEGLTRDQRAVGSSLTGVTALCSWARHINPCYSTDSTQVDLSQHNWKIVEWDVKNQTN